MRTFIISVILLFAVIAAVAANAVYTAETVDELIDKTSLLNKENIKTDYGRNIFKSVKELWNKKSKTLTCLYDYREIENVEISLLRMENCLLTESYEDFFISKGEFLYSVEKLKKISKASFENIM